MSQAEFSPRASSVAAWVAYDLANTIFALGVGSRYFAPWVIEESGGSDWHVSIATFVAVAIVIVLGPWLGALTDYLGRRRPHLIATTVLTVAATALLGSFGLLLSLVLYVVATVGFQLGAIAYNAMLPDVSTPRTRGRVSGLGVAVGYLGSLVAIGIGAFLLPRAGYAAVFRGLAVAFLLFALPAFFWIRERRRSREPGKRPGVLGAPGLMLDAWRQAGARRRGEVRFLVGRFLYTDAINVVFLFAAVFVKLELGLSDRETDIVAVAAVLAALVGAFGAGRLVDVLGPRRVLHAALHVLLGCIVFAAGAAAVGIADFGWLVGVAGGLGVGAVWASDRVYMTRISPPEKLGESFGLYATVGRFATIVGPLAWALITDVLALGRVVALGSLAFFLVGALIVLQGVRDDPPARSIAP